MTSSPDEPVEDATGGEPQETAAPLPGDPASGRITDPVVEPASPAASPPASPPASSTGGRRPGGDPEVHPDEFGRFGDDDEDQVAAAEGADLAASDELILAQTALAERTLDLQRLQAEFLNYKRRVDRDRDLVKQNATYSVLSGLLPVLDDIDRAREHGELEGGFKAVADSLERTVSMLGLTKYGAKGDAFDPNVHEALMHGHSPDVTTTTVDVVAQPGYRIGDRVVRAAKVTVLDPEN
ncbi:MAG: nucleotide exchange factor GrpE [Marmoricola sp.]